MDYDELCKMTYMKACKYLIDKYGQPGRNYFNEKWIKQKITRTSEGLYCHHVFENQYLKLSDVDYAKKAPIEAQHKENLLYCNAIEHLILHLIIHRENFNMSSGGIIFTLCECNSLYDDKGGKIQWRQSCFKAIQDYYDDYINLIVNNYCAIKLIFKNNPASSFYLGNITDLIAVKELSINPKVSIKVLNDFKSRLSN